MKRTLPLHPVLFAASPVLLVLAHNVMEARLSDAINPLLFVLACMAVAWVVARLIYRGWVNGAVVVSLALVLCFTYGHARFGIRDALGRKHPGALLTGSLFVLWTLTFCWGAWTVKRQRKPLRRLTQFLNVLSACSVALSVVTIASYKLRTARAAPHDAVSIEAVADRCGKPEPLPDIYYIILDRYSRADVLREAYGYDNSAFIDYLRAKGFYVASESCANYPKTAHSIASSLNMEHHLHLTDAMGEESDQWGPIHARVRDYKLCRFLKRKGYKYLHFGSWWSPTAANRLADENFRFSFLSEFSLALLQTSMLQPVEARFGFLCGRRVMWRHMLSKFEKLAEVPRIDEPKFVFAHFLLPHNPFVFDRDGNFVSEEQEGRRHWTECYKDQLTFTNKKVRELIDRLLARSGVPPIIVLQGDEGAYSADHRRLSRDWREISPEQLRTEMCVLNAYYLPGFPKEKLYPSITPVNSFRLILSHYFGADLPPLPDESYAFVDGAHLYQFFPVTDRLTSPSR